MIITILGIDLMFRSITGIVFTFAPWVPSGVYRARIEDKLLRSKSCEELENYADKFGFVFLKFRMHARINDLN